MERWRVRLWRTASALNGCCGGSEAAALPSAAGPEPRTTTGLGFAPTANVQTALRQLREDGFCVLSGVLDAEQVNALRQEVLAHVDDVASVLADAEASPRNRLEGLKYYYPEALNLDGTPGNDGGGIVSPDHIGNRAISGYVRFAPHWANRGCETPLVDHVVSGAVGQYYKMVYTTAFCSHSRGHVRWHHDDAQMQQFGEPIDVMGRLTTLWMLTDFTPDNGATLVVPRSHKPGFKASWSKEDVTSVTGVSPHHPEAVHAVGNAGDVLVFDARLWHSVAPNKTDLPRVYVKLRYAPPWMNNECISRTGGHNAGWDPLPERVWEQLSDQAKPHLIHAYKWDVAPAAAVSLKAGASGAAKTPG